ncbi:DUF262 domain-containing protein [Prescottella subtropica]|uniref:DUF262 domain-containing protein n=1 Tax=Prescottella subtropica TaxID=2545757 RepID=UPI0010F792DD|nr:DUF262 domain-containing protein [Prescottella subtropica]
MIKSVDNVPVYTLLSPENTIVYRIPTYQREYSWSKQQWDDLFDDLLDSVGDSGHFLGTIICVNQTENATQETVLELIDGQQRMTTLSLLLAAIHGCLEARRDQLDEDDLTDLTNLRRQLVLRRPIRPRLRPQKQNSNYEDYLNVLSRIGIDIEHPKVRNLGNRRIMRACTHFTNRIESRADETGRDVIDIALDMLGRVKNATLVKLEVESHSDAFVLFESLNNRGMPLTPIDLIKNNLLAASDRRDGFDTDKVFARWNDLLADLGDDYKNQERFFRQYYNAFKAALPAVAKAPIATRTNLIRIYETLIAADLAAFLDGITTVGSAYKRIIGNLDDEDTRTGLDSALRALSRAQGSPSHILLLFLMLRRDDLDLTETQLEQITRLLASFFVRRNLTGTPQTYTLQARFMDLIDQVTPLRGDDVEATVREGLRRVSASDEYFLEKLSGQIYDENADVARFVLVSLAEHGFTKETWTDLWERESTHYKWTIEHILPQGVNLPEEWVAMLGGDRETAGDIQQRVAHTLGNLTITGFNSNLGNRSFAYKKDRKDGRGNAIGFRNGLSLNADVVTADQWTEHEIEARTAVLAQRTLELFPI